MRDKDEHTHKEREREEDDNLIVAKVLTDYLTDDMFSKQETGVGLWFV